MTDVTLRGLRKAFGGVEVIRGVDLSIAPGEFVVFVGPSGCGKSTLLRLIAGLETATGGEIAIKGRTVTDEEPHDRGIAMVFQNYALYPHMTVADNMGFALRLARVPKTERRKAVEDAARILQIEPLLDRKPAQLSGGQRQRVAIGRAIVRRPDVFLFDEPLSNLDAELRVQMRIEIARLHRVLGATMIYVTHDQVEAMTLADRIVVLRSGVVEQVGTPLQLYDDPDDLFVAGFIGSPRMNFFTGTATADGIRLDGLGAVLPGPRVSEGTKVTVGCRPEHFLPDGGIPVSFEVTAVEQLGNVAYAYAYAPDSTGSKEPVSIEVRGGRGVRPGDRIETGFPPDRVLFFDSATGNRLR
jgi:lactose/L-arabinose transport system ATP-binding protein